MRRMGTPAPATCLKSPCPVCFGLEEAWIYLLGIPEYHAQTLASVWPQQPDVCSPAVVQWGVLDRVGEPLSADSMAMGAGCLNIGGHTLYNQLWCFHTSSV